jgi:hypothetical protein
MASKNCKVEIIEIGDPLPLELMLTAFDFPYMYLQRFYIRTSEQTKNISYTL